MAKIKKAVKKAVKKVSKTVADIVTPSVTETFSVHKLTRVTVDGSRRWQKEKIAEFTVEMNNLTEADKTKVRALLETL